MTIQLNPQQAKTILEDCVSSKGQTVVSLQKLAEVLNVPPLTKEEIVQIVENRKFPNSHKSVYSEKQL